MDKMKTNLTPADIRALIDAMEERFSSKQQVEYLEKKVDNIPDLETMIKAFDQRYASKQQLEEIEKKIDLLPTKEEYFSKADELYSEVKSEREENDIQHEKLHDHEGRIINIEKVLRLN